MKVKKTWRGDFKITFRRIHKFSVPEESKCRCPLSRLNFSYIRYVLVKHEGFFFIFLVLFLF